MENSTDGNKNHFDIHASIIFQLGENLISDPVQALVELIKNAYDADSRFVTVKIETNKPNDVEHSHYPGAKGFIIVKDGGEGMDIETIKKGWLTISNSLKRDMKSQGGKTQKGRTPLGDKGLGRLGAQRLGYNLEIFTRRENDPFEYHVAFSWKDFENKSKLDDIDIYTGTIPSTGNKGTTLLISDLKEQDFFKGVKAKTTIETELSKMLSPYSEIEEEIDEFEITALLDGEALNLASFKKEILDASEIRYTIDFDGNELIVKGKARLSFIRPQKKDEKILFRYMVEQDSGSKFFEFLSHQKKASDFNLKMSEEEGWFVEYEKTIKLENLDKREFIDIEGKTELANPGRFNGRVDSFELSKEGAAKQNIFDSLSEYKNYVKSLSGIRVYRDGFGIRVDKDWLELGKAWTSGLSYYGLKLENTLGYIALSARDNKNLEETTDREGFKISPYYNNFYRLLNEFKKLSGEVQEFLRRGWIEFCYKDHEEKANIDSDITPEELSEIISKSLSKAYSYHVKTEDLKIILNEKIPGEQKKIAEAADSLTGGKSVINNLKISVEELKKHIESANIFIDKIDEYLLEIKDLEEKEKVIKNRIQILRDQLEQLYEMAGLGLTAEALSHEIQYIVDNLKKRTEMVESYFKGQSRKDPKIASFFGIVTSAISSLRKQMSHLAPSMKYVRERKEKVEIFPFCREIAFFYLDRLKNNNIEIQVIPKNIKNFYVYMNRGKLTQIFDNLFFNSEYWLREDLRTKTIKNGKIFITIDKPFVQFSDNGRGVDHSVETTLFEPFVTAKGKEEGRGLGLFIVQQFLDSESCNIYLLPKRNDKNRFYIFEINFTGSMDEKR